ncbi:uncharacterized protein ACHE_60691A [Aspergillus chevalieri]|uniref:Uncharacterized protein n=1 Tax=Aspergillus chevalieri TaxID=182096 RepID=A0A7R7VU73_ASPCH|nr:uncharacterized protein ACHE_60691A [Aspergillus chevalieri]BCR90805.1 hypothetical protein ACHE_60691A [Aspergillus chevalieri]
MLTRISSTARYICPFRILQQLSTRRTLSTTLPRNNASPPPSAPKENSSYRDGMSRYKTFVSPFAKVFLGAIFTYQVIYWTWLKLETDEIKVEKTKVAALEKKARELTSAAK